MFYGGLLGLVAAPKWTDKLTAIGTAVIAGGVLFAATGAWLAWVQLRDTRRSRAIEIIANYAARWDEARLSAARTKRVDMGTGAVAKAVDAWVEDRNAPSDAPVLLRIPSYLEELAIMVEFGGLDIEFVAKNFSAIVLYEWDYWKPMITKIRDELDREAYVEFEKLWETFQEREETWR